MFVIGGILAKVLAFFSSQAFLGLANGVVGIINKKTDATVSINAADVAAGKEVDLAQISANVAAMHESAALATLRWGWWGTRYLLLFIAIPPAWHSGQIYLDSCALLFPIFGNGLFSLAPIMHEVGSWHVGRAPGVYEPQELSILATCVGVQTVQSIGGGIVAAITNKK